ncbi:hypothetical protein VNO78_02748 [Psophocarpus tetragonolobus]|uniref:Secreted protein n=1 Tax=Psophocarpus tetragonolobus TaxID=3891 RepID=A0AAN9XUZ6_PSOTE
MNINSVRIHYYSILIFCRCSIVVSISACHADDPGSIPGNGVFFLFFPNSILYYKQGPLKAPSCGFVFSRHHQFTIQTSLY